MDQPKDWMRYQPAIRNSRIELLVEPKVEKIL